MSTGAIPKRRGSSEARRNSSNSRVESPLHFVDDDDVGDDFEVRADEKSGQGSDGSKNYWRHRKNMRRRPPTPPTTTSTEGGGSVEVDLRQRIIDILGRIL